MAIPTPPAAPNPLGTNFAAEALAFTQWMHTAAPEFNSAVGDANQAVTDAEQAVVDAAAQVGLATTQAGNASASATTASGHATAADTARANAVIAKDAAEDARDMSQNYAALAGASAGLPALAGQALKNLRVKSDEAGVEWTAEAAPGSMARAAKTGAYTLVSADKGGLLDCSGTWTLGITAAATLGSGWWCYVRNVGTGTITADPSGSELIDGVTSGAIRPGMTLLVQCDGTAFHCVRVGPQVAMEVLTSGTSWTCPLGVRFVKATVVGGCGGGGSSTGPGTPGCGGAGGFAQSILPTTPSTAYTYSIGIGGAGGAGGGAGGAGGTTSLTVSSSISATGGAGGGGAATAGGAGGAGGEGSGGQLNGAGKSGDFGAYGGYVGGGYGGVSIVGTKGGADQAAGASGRIILEY